MRRSTIIFCLATMFVVSPCLLAAEVYYLPQVANGTYEQGSMRTTFILFNPTASDATATITFTDDQGETFEVTIPGFGTDGRFGPISLAAGQTRILQTNGTGALQAGAAHVEASGEIAVSAIFTLYDRTGAAVTEGGVAASTPLTDFLIPVDTTAPFNTGIALFNPSEQEVTVNFSLVGPNGAQVGTTSAGLLHFGHLARFVADQGGLFPAATGFRGTLRVHASRAVAAITLRQHADPLSNTTLPVVPTDLTATEFNLPQVANGQEADSSLRMRTTFVVLNLAQVPATVSFSLRKQDGTSMPVTIPGGIAENSAAFERVLPVGGSALFETDGSGALGVGSAEVLSTVPIGVAAIFGLYAGDEFLTEAGVGHSLARTTFTLPVDVRPGANTGVALFNPGGTPAIVTIRLLGPDGQRLAESDPLSLPAHNQTAQFVTELLPVPETLVGSLSITSTQPVAAITLRLNSPPLSYTTLPVVEGAYGGN